MTDRAIEGAGTAIVECVRDCDCTHPRCVRRGSLYAVEDSDGDFLDVTRSDEGTARWMNPSVFRPANRAARDLWRAMGWAK